MVRCGAKNGGFQRAVRHIVKAVNQDAKHLPAADGLINLFRHLFVTKVFAANSRKNAAICLLSPVFFALA
jgi:hypothetical protein